MTGALLMAIKSSYPDLFEAYPELTSVRVVVDSAMKGEGVFMPGARPVVRIKDPHAYKGSSAAFTFALCWVIRSCARPQVAMPIARRLLAAFVQNQEHRFRRDHGAVAKMP